MSDFEQWVPLSDVQWMNIVNYDHAWHSHSKEDAVHEAVKMTEAKCCENNAAKQSMQGEAKQPEYFSITDGDNWFECPDDSAILDCVHPVSVGTEYEVMAAYPSIRQTYRITKIPDDVNDDTEVELIASSGDLLYTHTPDSAARIAEQDARIEELEAENAKLKMAIEYDNAADDAEFEPPHPIFQLAQERDNYADQIRNLLALIAEKDKALKCVKAQLIDGKIFTVQLHQRPYWRYEVEEALSLTHDSVKLKEVSTVNSVAKGDESWLVVSDTLQEPVGIDRGTKLYTIVKGEAG